MVIAITVFATLVCLGFIFFLLFKLAQSNQQNGLKTLQEGLESLNRNLVHGQKEFERTFEVRNASLRSELQDSLQSNRKELTAGLAQTTNALEQKVLSMDQRLDVRLQGLTQNVGDKLEKNIKEGFVHFEKIQEHLKQAEKQLIHLNSVGESIHDLNNLLKLPHLRGSFGEAMLEQILQDTLPQGAFELQYRIVPNSTERVDAIIHYPTCVLPVDSKFPREQVLPLFEAKEPAELEAARKSLSEVMRSLGRQIREKYIHPEHGTTDMALLFVPSETLYFEVLRNTKLCDELGRMKIFAVSPNTLSVTLQAIALSRSYYDMARGVEKTISEIKKAQLHFKNFEGRFEDVGTALHRAQTAFQTASTHLSRYESAVTRLTGAEEEKGLALNEAPAPPPVLTPGPVETGI